MNENPTPQDPQPLQPSSFSSEDAAWAPYAIVRSTGGRASVKSPETLDASDIQTLIRELLSGESTTRALAFDSCEPLFSSREMMRVELPVTIEPSLTAALVAAGWELARLDQELQALEEPCEADVMEEERAESEPPAPSAIAVEDIVDEKADGADLTEPCETAEPDHPTTETEPSAETDPPEASAT